MTCRTRAALAGAAFLIAPVSTAAWAAPSQAAPPPAPNCAAGTPYPTSGKHPDCVIASWHTPAALAKAVSGSLSSMTRKWVKGTPSSGYSHWAYKLTFNFHDPLKLCPSPTVNRAVPCQEPYTSIGYAGQYVAGAAALQQKYGVIQVQGTCNHANTRCTASFGELPYYLYGSIRMVWVMSCQQITKVGKNDLGQAGVEIPVSISVTKLPLSKDYS